jgi:phage-related minor tail protein
MQRETNLSPFFFFMPTRKKTVTRDLQDREHLDSEKKEETTQEKPTKRRYFKKTAQEQIEQSYKSIVNKLAEEAEKGSVRHTKMLFDLGGVQEKAESAKRKRKKAPSLGKLLMDEVEAMKRSQQEKQPNDGES